nr:glycine receptor subunit alpha-4-like [Lytechinus pictus]
MGTTRDPVNIYIDVFLASLDGIDEKNLDYTITATIHQRWYDPRLTFNRTLTLPPSAYLVDKLWHPNLIIGNAKETLLHHISHQNQLVTIDPEGNVTFSQRLSLKLSCNMDFHRFPMDYQKCNLDLQSFGLTTNFLVFMWGDQKMEFHSEHLKLPQYVLTGVDFFDCTEQHYNGIFSCIRAQFTMERTLGYYMLQAFIPSIALVMVSWVTFWIDVRASPARVGLGVTIILSVISKTNGVRLDIPPVSYLKAIDVWYTSCLLFVIGSLLEYALVHHLSLSPKKTKQRVLAIIPKQDPPIQENISEVNHGSLYNISSSHPTPSQNQLIRRDATTGELRTIATAPSLDNKPQTPLQTTSRPTSRLDVSVQGKDTSDKRGQEASILDHCRALPGETHLIDLFCRWLFPIGFAIFNICFWAYYMPPHYTPAYLANDEKFVSHSVGDL